MPKALPLLDVTAPICCAPVSATPISDDDALHLALRLKALADPVRIKLLSLLLTAPDHELCTGDLAGPLTVAESTVSHHLAQLRKAGIVDSTRRGMSVHHRVRRDSLDALRAVLDPNCCTAAGCCP